MTQTLEVRKKRITLATIKSFINKRRDRLYVSTRSSFDGMTDCVETCAYQGFEAARESSNPHSNNMGIEGVWFVFGSRDYFEVYEDNAFIGFTVWNCCGKFIVAVRK